MLCIFPVEVQYEDRNCSCESYLEFEAYRIKGWCCSTHTGHSQCIYVGILLLNSFLLEWALILSLCTFFLRLLLQSQFSKSTHHFVFTRTVFSIDYSIYPCEIFRLGIEHENLSDIKRKRVAFVAAIYTQICTVLMVRIGQLTHIKLGETSRFDWFR